MSLLSSLFCPASKDPSHGPLRVALLALRLFGHDPCQQCLGIQSIQRGRHPKKQLSGVRLRTMPAGYNFDIFIDPHAIDFTVVAVPELSSFARLTATLLLMAIIQARR